MTEETLLNRGLSFCPTSKLDEVQLCQSKEFFFSEVRFAEYFEESYSENVQLNHTVHRSSVWTPLPGRHLCIDTFVNHDI